MKWVNRFVHDLTVLTPSHVIFYTLRKAGMVLTPLTPRGISRRINFPTFLLRKMKLQTRTDSCQKREKENTHVLIKMQNLSKIFILHIRYTKLEKQNPGRRKGNSKYMKTACWLSHYIQIFFNHELSGKMSLKKTFLFDKQKKSLQWYFAWES